MSAPQRPERHWADVAADAALASGGASPLVATGISPSGPFHIGHLREILTGDAVARVLRERGAAARLVFIVDNLDPLRRVAPFLDPAVYAPLVGRSLCELPAPDGVGGYDEHFLAPFLAALKQLWVELEVRPADELYASGRMNGVIFEALERSRDIARILQEVTGREVEPHWSPWNPRCPACRKLTLGVVLGWDREAASIRSRCGHCGVDSEQPAAGGGKLTWRVDWAARWKALGVAVEPFGKDHASKGGSYDTGARLAREVFGVAPPLPVVYEWIALKGQGDMASSKGNVLTVSELLDMAPPEVLRYLVFKTRPNRSIAFDPGRPLLQLIDEVDDAHAAGRDDRAFALSRGPGHEAVGAPFHHLVLVAQAAGFDVERALELLARGGWTGLDRDAVAGRLRMAKAWLARHAPEELKVEVAETLPAAAKRLAADQKAFLRELAARLPGLADGDAIQQAIRELAAAPGGPGAARGFAAVYTALFGRERGPRAGAFIAVYGVARAAARLREAGAA